MNDSISKEEAISVICRVCEVPNMYKCKGRNIAFKWCEEITALKEIPSAGPKKGKWIPHSEKSREYIGTALVNVEYDYWFCDTCGYRVENGQPIYNFCPHCGADMRSGKEERWTKNSLKKDEKY